MTRSTGRIRPADAAARILAPLGLGSPEELRESLWEIAAYRGVLICVEKMDGLSGRIVRRVRPIFGT